MARSRKQYSSADSVVKTKFEHMFKERCKAQLRKMKCRELPDKCSIFGSVVLDPKSSSQCIGYIRGFVHFLLDYKGNDDSLLVFYPKTPKGTITVSDQAAAHYLMSRMGKKGEPLLDKQVRSKESKSTIQNIPIYGSEYWNILSYLISRNIGIFFLIKYWNILNITCELTMLRCCFPCKHRTNP